MRTVQLSVWDRIQIGLAIPRNAPLKEIRVLLDIDDKVRLSEEEKELVKLQELKIATSQGIAVLTDFDESSAALWDSQSIEFENAECDKLKQIVSARTNWPTKPESLALQAKVLEA
jgi:hypothetical protein